MLKSLKKLIGKEPLSEKMLYSHEFSVCSTKKLLTGNISILLHAPDSGRVHVEYYIEAPEESDRLLQVGDTVVFEVYKNRYNKEIRPYMYSKDDPSFGYNMLFQLKTDINELLTLSVSTFKRLD